jgi:hypothetical protein
MVRKKIDYRIRVLIENGVTLRHRIMFVVIGDKGQVGLISMVRTTCVCFGAVRLRTTGLLPSNLVKFGNDSYDDAASIFTVNILMSARSLG